MGAIKEFIAERGFTLMLCGFAMAAVGVLFYAFVAPRYASPFYPQAAVAVAVAGFAVYFTGRISVAMRKRRPAKPEGDDI
ncbi:MAG: hypothetical protein LBH93_03870 [Chitinispirillales bacterium]|jgi:uncharacterized membrane protein|nr:hypothetical protein [Chitinispirillales bacterium]